MPIIRSSRLIRSPLAVAAIAITFLITAALQAQLSVSPPRISPGGVLKLTSRALAKQDPGLRFVTRSTGGRPVQVELEIEKPATAAIAEQFVGADGDDSNRLASLGNTKGAAAQL